MSKSLTSEAQIATLSQELAQAKKQLKQQHLKHGLYRAICEEMETLITPLDPPPLSRIKKGGTIVEHLVMHVSDAHADERVTPGKVGGFEKYDFPTALCRAEQYVDTVINFTQDTLVNYNFDTLWFLSYGDMTSGEIHGAASRSEYQNMFKNCFAIGQMQACMIRDLSSRFKRIKVVCVSGNHGRRSIKKDYEGAHDNWDYLIAEVTRMHCRDLLNVEFAIPDAWTVLLDINGWYFHVAHGDDIKSWNSIPFYGIERATRRLTALHHTHDVKAHYYVLGHHHTCSSLADLKGETFINGAWPATSPYSFNAFAGYREPMQLLHGVHASRGVSWRMPVKLKNPEREAKGPTRYACCLREDE